MSNITPNIKEQARQMAREVLSMSESFRTMPVEEQRSIYMNLVNENIDKLSKQHNVSQSMAKGPGADMGFKGYDPGFEGSVDAFEDLVDSVDFPKFVADLMKGVFDANINVMRAQTDDYIRLLKEATKSVSKFIQQISEEDAVGYLAENKSDMYNMIMEKGADGSEKMALTTPQGEKVDMEDNEVKAKMMEAKIAIAKEHRATLREMILMGVTRLVVEKGEIEAGVEFKITANRTSKKTNSNTNINTVGGSFGYGIFGGPSTKANFSNTNINVSTSSKDTKDELSAKLMGKVNIKFKTDYFKLDNFAQMYGDGGVAAFKPEGQKDKQLPPSN